MPYGRRGRHRLARPADTGIVTTARVKRSSGVLRAGHEANAGHERGPGILRRSRPSPEDVPL